jgi:prolyl-tRNA synthetase
MGSYGIGIERIAAAYIEQNHDKDGIIWGGEIAPFKIYIVSVGKKSGEIKQNADKLYDALQKAGYEVLFDDREDISPGIKFKDADLLGIPIQLVISEKNMKNDEIEVKLRKTGTREMIKTEDIFNRLPFFIEKV